MAFGTFPLALGATLVLEDGKLRLPLACGRHCAGATGHGSLHQVRGRARSPLDTLDGPPHPPSLPHRPDDRGRIDSGGIDVGRASRNKQTRRNGRRWSTIDPDSGETQVFTVYINDAALRQWERNRRSLRAGGYPDRPPEIDTPNARMWNLDGGRATQIDLASAVHALGVDPTALAVGTWRSCTPGGEFGIKLNVGRRGDGVFVVHLVAESCRGFRWERIAEARTAGELAERTSAFAEVARALELPEPTWISADALLGEVATASAPPTTRHDNAA